MTLYFEMGKQDNDKLIAERIKIKKEFAESS